jgi:hypothetical protein
VLLCSDFIIQELQERLASHMAQLSSAQSELIWTKGQVNCLEHFNEHLQLQLDLQEQELQERRQSLQRWGPPYSTSSPRCVQHGLVSSVSKCYIATVNVLLQGLTIWDHR